MTTAAEAYAIKLAAERMAEEYSGMRCPDAVTTHDFRRMLNLLAGLAEIVSDAEWARTTDQQNVPPA